MPVFPLVFVFVCVCLAYGEVARAGHASGQLAHAVR